MSSPRPMTIEMVIPGRPTPKARPRMNTKTRTTYTPTAREEDRVATAMLPYRGAFFDAGRIAVSLFLYGAKTTADIDNIAKLYIDAMVKAAVIEDDRVIDALWVERRHNDDDPKAVVVVGLWDPA